MKAVLLFALAIWIGIISPVHAQQTTPTALAAPSIKYGTGTWGVPTPVQLVGYDSSTQLPCIVGYSATCLLTTSGGGGAGGGTSSTFGAAFPTIGTAIGLSDGTDMQPLKGDTTNGAWVNVKTSVLPTGAALDTTLQSILTKLNASIAVTGTFWQATQPVSAASLPLPSGAATAANQTAIQGIVAAGTAPANMVVGGAIYNSSPPTPSAGQSLALQMDASGRLRTASQPATQNFVTGTANTTGTGTTSLVGAVASNRIYATAISCGNTGSTAALISFQDGSGGATLWAQICPAGGGFNLAGPPMFRTTSGNALYFAASAGSTTISVSAAGFSGP